MCDEELVLKYYPDDEPWPSRTIAYLRGNTIAIRHQYYKDGKWWTWQDEGASIPVAAVALLHSWLKDENETH